MTETTPILIVGAGGSGLTLSILLADYGVNCITVERNATTTELPRAHIINQRTMEIFRQHGFADRVYAQGASIHQFHRISFRTSLGGSGPLDRRIIGDLDGYGGGALQERYDADSACQACNLPQNRLEPLLREVAEERAPGRIRFSHELVGFAQDADGVTAHIRDQSNDRDYTVRCRYLIAADGGKTVGRALGIEMTGPRRLRQMVNTFFSADLSPYVDDDSVGIFYFINPDVRGQWAGGGLVKSGPKQWDRHSETWNFMRELGPDEPDTLDPTTAIERVRGLLKIPDLEMTVHGIGRWEVQGVHAERYRVGNIFIAGDAGHRHPPVSALGLNTGVGDVHNLAWKLALVLAGKAGDSLLDSYHSERQPVGTRVAEWALNGFRMRALIDQAIGITSGDADGNRAAFERLYAETEGGATARAILGEAMRIQRIGPQAHDMEIGTRYEAGALVPDGSKAPPRDPMAGSYTPSTRPGSRLPHAWISNSTGRTSTHDTARPGRFTLLCCETLWQEAAAIASRDTRVPIDTIMIPDEGKNDAAAPTWAEVRGVTRSGAVLVRPDAHVAWRADAAPTRPDTALTQALLSVLGRT